MFLPEKLLEKAFYWGPLFVGVISLVTGTVLVQLSYNEPSSFHRGQIARSSNKAPEAPLGKQRDSLSAAKQANIPLRDNVIARENEASEPASRFVTTRTKKILPDAEGRDTWQATERLKALAGKAAAEKKSALNESARNVGAFAGKLAGSSLLSAMAVTELNAASFKMLSQNLSADRFAKLAGDMRSKAYVGVRLLEDGPLRIITAYNGYLLGKPGGELHAGLAKFAVRQTSPLIAHKISMIGEPASLAFVGSLHGRSAGAVILDDYVETWSGEVGAVPLFILTGLANSLDGATSIKRQYELYQIGGLLSRRTIATSYKGLGRAVEKSETLIVPVVSQTALPADISTVKPENGNCADRFYAALGKIYTTKIAFLRDAAKPISTMDNEMPGQWYFGIVRAGMSSKALRRCKRWKTYNSGRRKCLKWERAAKPDIVRADPSAGQYEKEFYALAHNLVLGKGRHTLVKVRSPSHWVINRIATDLKIYSKQAPHPAICTGALGMMSYFDGNLGRVKKHISEMAEMALKSEQIIKVKGFRLNEALGRFQREQEVHKRLKEQPSFINGDVAEEIKLANGQKDRTDNDIDGADEGVTKNQFAIAVSPADLPKTLIAFGSVVYGPELSEELKLMGDDLARLKLVRQFYDKNRAVYNAPVNKAIYQFLHALEASLYIRRADRIYKSLSQRLFGSIEAIRSAHKSQCVCSD